MMMAWLCVLVKGGNVPGPIDIRQQGDALSHHLTYHRRQFGHGPQDGAQLPGSGRGGWVVAWWAPVMTEADWRLRCPRFISDWSTSTGWRRRWPLCGAGWRGTCPRKPAACRWAVLTDLRATSILDAHEHFMLT